MKNNIWSKILRNISATFLPVSKKRKGQCNRCSACCKIPYVCPFLKYNDNHKAYCDIYLFRPSVCRKYPRTSREFITEENCGYYFEK